MSSFNFDKKEDENGHLERPPLKIKKHLWVSVRRIEPRLVWLENDKKLRADLSVKSLKDDMLLYFLYKSNWYVIESIQNGVWYDSIFVHKFLHANIVLDGTLFGFLYQKLCLI